MKKQSVYLHTNGYYDYLVTNHSGDLIDHVERKEGHFFTSEELNEYTQKVIKQALKTAAEKADPNILNKRPEYAKFTIVDVDKQSITNTFEETFNKFKV